MKSFNEFLVEEKTRFTFDQLKEYFDQHDFLILSAYRGDKSASENRSNSKKLESALKSSPYSYEPAKGGFIENKGTENERYVDEPSFVVVDVNNARGLLRFGIKQGMKFEQDSILFSDATMNHAVLIGTTSRPDAELRQNERMKVGKPRWGSRGEYYTKIKAGFFTFG